MFGEIGTVHLLTHTRNYYCILFCFITFCAGCFSIAALHIQTHIPEQKKTNKQTNETENDFRNFIRMNTSMGAWIHSTNMPSYKGSVEMNTTNRCSNPTYLRFYGLTFCHKKWNWCENSAACPMFCQLVLPSLLPLLPSIP